MASRMSYPVEVWSIKDHVKSVQKVKVTVLGDRI